MTTKLGVISICTLVILISRSIKIDFVGNTRNTFFATIKNIIFEYFNYFNSIYIRR